MSDSFDNVTDRKYTVRFAQVMKGKTSRGFDVRTKR
jgi:hypothetical protein